MPAGVCQETVQSFGNEAKAKSLMKNHLQGHIKDTLKRDDYNDFTAEPITARRKRIAQQQMLQQQLPASNILNESENAMAIQFEHCEDTQKEHLNHNRNGIENVTSNVTRVVSTKLGGRNNYSLAETATNANTNDMCQKFTENSTAMQQKTILTAKAEPVFQFKGSSSGKENISTVEYVDTPQSTGLNATFNSYIVVDGKIVQDTSCYKSTGNEKYSTVQGREKSEHNDISIIKSERVGEGCDVAIEKREDSGADQGPGALVIDDRDLVQQILSDKALENDETQCIPRLDNGSMVYSHLGTTFKDSFKQLSKTNAGNQVWEEHSYALKFTDNILTESWKKDRKEEQFLECDQKSNSRERENNNIHTTSKVEQIYQLHSIAAEGPSIVKHVADRNTRLISKLSDRPGSAAISTSAAKFETASVNESISIDGEEAHGHRHLPPEPLSKSELKAPNQTAPYWGQRVVVVPNIIPTHPETNSDTSSTTMRGRRPASTSSLTSNKKQLSEQAQEQEKAEALLAIRQLQAKGATTEDLCCHICQPPKCFTAYTTLLSHLRSHAGIRKLAMQLELAV